MTATAETSTPSAATPAAVSAPAPVAAPAKAPISSLTVTQQTPAPAAVAETVKVPAIADPAAAKPADAAATPAAETKPATTEWSLKAPEGAAISADDLKAVEAFAKDNGYSVAQAEKLLGRDLAQRAAAQAAQEAETKSIGQTWLDQAKADPVIGGDKFAATQEAAKQGMMAVLTPEQRQLIADSPFANNPLWLSAMAKVASLLPKEDTLQAGATAGAAVSGKTGPQVLYPMYYKK